MSDYAKFKELGDALKRAIEQAEHKPGEWAGTAQSMGGICCPGVPFQIGKPWAKEEPWASFSYKRDSWLAVAAVNALPQMMALICENERLLKLLERTAEQHVPLTELEGVPGWSRVVELVEVVSERDQLKAEVAGLKTGYEAYERVVQGLKVENAALSKAYVAAGEREHELRTEIALLRKDADRYQWLRDGCGIVEYKKIAGSIGTGMLPSGEKLEAAIDAAMDSGEQS